MSRECTNTRGGESSRNTPRSLSLNVSTLAGGFGDAAAQGAPAGAGWRREGGCRACGLGARHAARATAAEQQQHNDVPSARQQSAQVRGKSLRSEYRYQKAQPARMRLSKRSRAISTVTSSPCEDAPGRRSLRSLGARCSTGTSNFRELGSNVILLTGISMRLFPRRRRGLLLVVTMTMEAFAMRSEGRTASNFWK